VTLFAKDDLIETVTTIAKGLKHNRYRLNCRKIASRFRKTRADDDPHPA
jgi:hypothetical protein